MYVYQGNTYKIRAGDLLNVAGVPLTRQVIAGTGLTGGGQLSNNVTLSIAVGGVGPTELAPTGVTPGVYGSGTQVPLLTITSDGRVAAASNVDIEGINPVTPDAPANTFYAGPVSGAPSTVTFRQIVVNDVPVLNQNTTGTAASATNLLGGAASQIPYQSATGVTAFVPNGSSGQVLRSNGASAPTFFDIAGGTF